MSAHFDLPRLASLQTCYTLVGRMLERELEPMLASEGLDLMVWSPVAGGVLLDAPRRCGRSGGRG